MTIKSKINLTIISFFLLVISFFVFIVQPSLKEIKNNSQSFISEKAKLLSLEDKSKNLENLKASYGKTQNDLEKIDDLLINSELPVEFISFLEKTAEDSQVKIKISPISCGKTEKALWSSLCFQINLTGSFSNFSRFFEKLENAFYLISIQNLNINSQGEKNDIQATFSLKVYAK